MALIPLVYFSLFTFAMAVYSDKQLLKMRSPSKVINEFLVVLVANLIASWYMIYSIVV